MARLLGLGGTWTPPPAEWRQWSDREIARRAQVSDRFVNKLRSELTANIRSDDPTERTYTTKHGTTATMDTSRIGKVPQNQIAGHVGVSAQYVSKIVASINQFIDRPSQRRVTRNGTT